jgi:hypothetical protein
MLGVCGVGVRRKLVIGWFVGGRRCGRVRLQRLVLSVCGVGIVFSWDRMRVSCVGGSFVFITGSGWVVWSV